MPSPRLVLPASTLLVLGLCWSLSANPTTERPPDPGFVTSYVTPMANLTLDKLVGRWFVAEHVSFLSPPNITDFACLLLEFEYDVNGTLVVDPITLIEGISAATSHPLPVNENGVWDAILHNSPVNSHAILHVDDRFLAVASCTKTSVMDCGAYVLVRHVADADRQADLEEVHRRVADAGVDNIDGGFVKVIEPCRSNATAAFVLFVQNGPSTPDTD